MKLPDGFALKNSRKRKTRQKKTIEDISDIVLDYELPRGYYLKAKYDYTSELNDDIIHSPYGFLIPRRFKRVFRTQYKHVESKTQVVTVDIFEFESKKFVLEKLDKFYEARNKLNNNNSTEYDCLVKGRYVVFLKTFWTREGELKPFIEDYKTKFNMKEITFNLK